MSVTHLEERQQGPICESQIRRIWPFLSSIFQYWIPNFSRIFCEISRMDSISSWNETLEWTKTLQFTTVQKFLFLQELNGKKLKIFRISAIRSTSLPFCNKNWPKNGHFCFQQNVILALVWWSESDVDRGNFISLFYTV